MLLSGLVSGLTLGLLSLDRVELEVVKRRWGGAGTWVAGWGECGKPVAGAWSTAGTGVAAF